MENKGKYSAIILAHTLNVFSLIKSLIIIIAFNNRYVVDYGSLLIVFEHVHWNEAISSNKHMYVKLPSHFYLTSY